MAHSYFRPMRERLSTSAQFGEFLLNVQTGELSGCGETVVLPGQALQILLLLIERHGGLVTREELRKKLWPNDTVVEFEYGINNNVKKLRRAMGDSADAPRYIETLARRGYRLIVPVAWVGPVILSDERNDESKDPYSRDGSSHADVSSRANPERSRGGAEGPAVSDDLPKASLQVGRLTGKIVSHYRVLEVIGGGGMGLVYRAEDLKLGRAVALKFLPEEVGDDHKARERFEREAKAVSALNHFNICTVYDFDEYEGHPFIAMELLQGKTLRDHLADGRFRLSQPEGLEVAIQIASGLEAAHEKGIIHRDIKPANIFITEKNVAKILDFGVAKVLQVESHATKGRLSGAPELPSSSGVILRGESPGPAGANGVEEPAVSSQGEEELQVPRLGRQNQAPSLGMTHEINAVDGAPEGAPLEAVAAAPARETSLTRTGVKLGTAGYMSPEQIRGEPLDVRTDIFSFGLVLYEMATGERAFTGETEAILHDAIENREAKAVRELAPALSPRLGSVIDKCLEKERARRFQAICEVSNELRQAEQPPPLVVESGKAPQRQWTKLWRPLAVISALVLLGIISAVVYRRMNPSFKLTDKDTIVLAEFENRTSDPIFTGTFAPALEVAFGQTPFLNPLSTDKIEQVLKTINKPQKERLTPALARDICLRTNSTAYVAGSISDVGNHYRIDLSAIDCKTGKTAASAWAMAEDRNLIVATLGNAAYSLRQNLGEPATLLREFNMPLAEATTASLEALQTFAAAEARNSNLQALPDNKRALELDPEFALAYEKLGLAYQNGRQSALAEQNFTKAYQLRERRSSRRNRLAIEALYYDVVTGEYDKAIATAKQTTQEFPQWFRPRQILGGDLIRLGEYQRASDVLGDALRLQPDANGSLVAGLAVSYVGQDRLADARLVLDEAAMRKVDDITIRLTRYELAFLENHRQSMTDQVNWATDKPLGKDLLLDRESETEAYYGHLSKADDLSGQAAESALQAGAPGKAANWKSSHALRLARTGMASKGLPLVQEAMSMNPDSSAQLTAAWVLAIAGDSSRALSLAQEVGQRRPFDTLVQGCSLPAIRAEVYLRQGQANLAIKTLEEATPSQFPHACDPGWMYLRAEAFMKAGRAQEAAGQFRNIIERPGVAVHSRNLIALSLSHLQLARALVMMDDKEGARKSYQEFLTLWKDADPDIPIYRQAKAEYAKLSKLPAAGRQLPAKSSQLSAVSHQ